MVISIIALNWKGIESNILNLQKINIDEIIDCFSCILIKTIDNGVDHEKNSSLFPSTCMDYIEWNNLCAHGKFYGHAVFSVIFT